MSTPSIALYDDGAVSCATVLWRFRGKLQLTVVAKALFTIVPDGVAAPAGPGAIVTKDRHRDGHPARSVEAASDLAPYLARCDVVFTGHAYAPGGRAPAGSVRLGVSRDGRPLLDKTLHVFGDRGPAGPVTMGETPKPPAQPLPFTRIPIIWEKAAGGLGEANPTGTEAPNLVDPADARRPAGFGPISRYWKARRGLLGGVDAKQVEATPAQIPEAMPWEYFQAAPPDQQIEHLRGGEWMVLDGLHPTLPRVQTRLPPLRGAARVSVQRPGVPVAELAMELACDTLAIDGDRQVFSLAWRGRCEVPEGDVAVTVLAALEAPGAPVDWARIQAGPRHASVAPPAAAPAPNLLSTVVGTDAPSGPSLPFSNDSAAAVLSRLPPTPALPREARRPKPGSKATMALSLDQLPPANNPLPFAPTSHDGGYAPKPPLKADHDTGRPPPGEAATPSRPPPPKPPSAPPAPMPGAPWGPPAVPPPLAAEGATTLPDQPAVISMAALMDDAPPPVPAPRSTPPPPADPWAKPAAPPPDVEPTKPSAPPPPPPAFERPAAAAVKGSFYAKFKK